MKNKGISLITLIITIIVVIILVAIVFRTVVGTSYRTRQVNYCPTCGREY